MDVRPDLNRFIHAQDDQPSGLSSALLELGSGRKTGHWIWYVFPQLTGLGRSAMAQVYALADIAEAEAYLRHPVLGVRLLAAAQAVSEQARAGVPLERLMGSSIDVLKLVSSMTLFGALAARTAGSTYAHLAATADEILKAAEFEGYKRCAHTLRALSDAPPHAT